MDLANDICGYLNCISNYHSCLCQILISIPTHMKALSLFQLGKGFLKMEALQNSNK